MRMMNKKQKIRILGCVIFSLLGALLVWAATSKSIGVSPDSIDYVSGANSLIDQGQYKDFQGNHIIFFPPGYSSVLATTVFIYDDIYANARILNAFLLGVTILCLSLWAAFRVRSDSIFWLGTYILLFSTPLLPVSSYLWSEILFISLATATLVVLDLHAEKGKLFHVLLIGFLTVAACMTRFVGLAIIVTVIIHLTVVRKPTKLKELTKETATFFLIVSAPLALWLFRNWHLDGTLTGPRPEAIWSVAHNTFFVIRTYAKWIGMSFLGDGVRSVLFLIIVGLILIYTIVSKRNKKFSIVELTSISPFVTYAACYSVLIIVLASRSKFDILDDRLLSPASFSLIVCLMLFGDYLCTHAATMKGGGKARIAIVTTMLIVLALHGTYRTFSYVTAATNNGPAGYGGYATLPYFESPTLKYVDSLDMPDLVYCNLNKALYFHTGIIAQSPSSETLELLSNGGGESDAKAIVWFNNPEAVWWARIQGTASPEDVLHQFEAMNPEKFEDGFVVVIP